MGEDWIIREINDTRDSLDNLIKSYRFAEALELVYDLIWNKYADWFLESQKLYKNIPLLKESLEQILILFHPFAPFTTETIWQNLSWTSNLLINTKNPEKLASDPISAEQFETVKLIVSEVRKALNALPDGRDNHLTFVVDSLVEENADLIKSLARLASVHKVELAKGLRIPVPNRELFLDIDEETLKKHRDNLKSRILSLASEIDTLNMRLFNPNYIHKAPSALVEETRRTLDEKSTLLEKLKEELTLI
jgi:valyl-tRNA synthetase